ncbi:hypothetical protein [Paraburkholderia sp.]|uniref:hypothetical protein n=1 Tax=Paraburkholderia sp. TaxID=1926495 RepID=UPI0039E5981D
MGVWPVDRGFITFDDDESLRAAREVPPDALAMIGYERTLRRVLTRQEKAFLAFHRDTLFDKAKPKATRKRRRVQKEIAMEEATETAHE